MNIFKDVCITISRILVGIVLIAHGWQKYDSWTIDGTAQSFESMSVPWPNASAQIATYFELAAGVLLILGLLVRIVGPLLFIQMAFAFGFAHWGKGVFIADGGWELVGVLGAAGLALAASGSGRFSLDYLFMTPVRARKERKEKAAQEANGSYAPAAAPAGAAGAPNAAPNAGQSPYGSYGSANQGSNFQGSNYQGSNFQGSPAQGSNPQSSNYWGNNQSNKPQSNEPWSTRGNDGYGGYTTGSTDSAASAGAAGAAGGAGAAGMTNGSDADAPTTQWNSDQSSGPSSNNSFGGFSNSGSDSGSDSGSSGGDGGGDGGGGD